MKTFTVLAALCISPFLAFASVPKKLAIVVQGGHYGPPPTATTATADNLGDNPKWLYIHNINPTYQVDIAIVPNTLSPNQDSWHQLLNPSTDNYGSWYSPGPATGQPIATQYYIFAYYLNNQPASKEPIVACVSSAPGCDIVYDPSQSYITANVGGTGFQADYKVSGK